MFRKQTGMEFSDGVNKIFRRNELMDANAGLSWKNADLSLNLQANPLSTLLGKTIGEENPKGLPNYADMCTFSIDSDRL
jgi:hypothetical protein